jgi:Ca-activated chloride channel homolog
VSRLFAAAAAVAAVAVAAGTIGVPAQVFRTSTEAVRVDVLVTSGNKPVGGLMREDFEVLDNGVSQAIENVTIEEVPFSMLLALDVSASMEGDALKDLKEAALAAVDAMRPGDRAAILTFSEELRLQARWLSKGAALVQSIPALQAAGATALFDAAFTALSIRDPEAGRRSLVLLFSDGEDTSSWLPARAPLEKADRTDSVVYTVALGPPVGRSADQDRATFARNAAPAGNQGSNAHRRLLFRSGVRLSPGAALIEQSPFLPSLAERTGGEAINATASTKLRETFERIVVDFRSRYLLSYVPNGVDTPGWHRIEVKLRHRAGHITARRGYQR